MFMKPRRAVSPHHWHCLLPEQPSQTPTLCGVHFSLLLSGLLLELHVAEMHDAPGQLINANLFIGTEAQHVKGNL